MQARGRQSKKQHGNGPTELYDDEVPGPNDVLFGRGTGSNMHTGNVRYRALIQKYKPIYRDTPKKLKPSVSTKVVAIWRSQNPPGRFLTRSDRCQGSRGTFYDVGDAMARRKAAQCLREKSSQERLQNHEQAGDKEESEEAMENNSTSREEGDDSHLFDDGDDALFLGLGGSSRAANNDQAIPNDAISVQEEVAQDRQMQSQETFSHCKKEDDVAGLVTTDNLALQFGSSTTKLNVFSGENLPELTSHGLEALINSDKLEKTQEAPWLASGSLSGETLAEVTSQGLKEFINSSKLKKTQEAAWLASGSPKRDTLSLVDTYESHLTEADRNLTSDSPFLFASFDFESSNRATSGDKGSLSFPSLFGGANGGNAGTSLFDDDNSSTSFFSGGSPSPFPFEDPSKSREFRQAFPISLLLNTAKEDTLQNIRDRIPTAASLTTNLFDW